MTHTKQKLFLGVTNDNELYYVEIENRKLGEQEPYLSVTGSTVEAIEAEQGEAEAYERLMDGELWRMAVDQQQTEEGLSEWANNVIAMDGWQSQYDIDQSIDPVQYEGKEYFFDSRSGGQHVIKLEDMKKLFVEVSVYKAIMRLWNEYHLKTAPKWGDKDYGVYNLVMEKQQEEEKLLAVALSVMTNQE